jgi:hypothetical protein
LVVSPAFAVGLTLLAFVGVKGAGYGVGFVGFARAARVRRG